MSSTKNLVDWSSTSDEDWPGHTWRSIANPTRSPEELQVYGPAQLGTQVLRSGRTFWSCNALGESVPYGFLCDVGAELEELDDFLVKGTGPVTLWCDVLKLDDAARTRYAEQIETLSLHSFDRDECNHVSVDWRHVLAFRRLTALSAGGGMAANRDVLRGLEQLSALRLSIDDQRTTDLAFLNELPNLRSLSLSLSPVDDLPSLPVISRLESLEWNASIKKDGIRQLARLGARLRELVLSDVPNGDLRPIGELKRLYHLAISGKELTSLEPLDGLTELRSLAIGNAVHLSDVDGLKQLQKLSYLEVGRCTAIDLARLATATEGLVSLGLPGNCDDEGADGILRKHPKLKALSCFADGYFLQSKLETLDALRHVPELRRLSVSAPKTLRSVDGLRRVPQLEELFLRRCGAVKDFSAVGSLKNLKQVDLDHCVTFRDCSLLTHSPGINSLTLDGTGVSDLSPLERLPNLVRLDLGHCETTSLDALAKLPNLTKLGLGTGIKSLWSRGIPSPSLSSLDYLHLSSTPIENVLALEHCTELHTLEIKNCDALASLVGIGRVRSLENLVFSPHRVPRSGVDLGELRHCTHLRRVQLHLPLDAGPEFDQHLSTIKSVEWLLPSGLTRDLEFVRGLENLIGFVMNGSDFLEDISALSELPKLKYLVLYGCNALEDLEPLAELSKVEQLDLTFTRVHRPSLLLELPSLQRVVVNDIDDFDVDVTNTLRFRGVTVAQGS